MSRIRKRGQLPIGPNRFSSAAEYQNPSNWQMLGPRPPNEDDYCKGTSIGVYLEGSTPNEYLEPTNTVPAVKVAQMRYFAVLDEMSDCGFNLLEMKDGSFRVGQLADNWPE